MRDPAWGEGRYLDSFSAHVDRLDYAPEHLAHSTLPLAWQADAEAPGGFRVCQPVAAATFAYANGLRALMDAHGKLILVNQFGHGAPCPFHVFDCLGKEYWVSGAGRLLQRYRAVSQHKVVSNLPSDKPIPDTALREFLVYGVFPGGYGRGDWGQEQMRAAYRRVLPLLRLEHRLRWEPVPHARAQSGVVVERLAAAAASRCAWLFTTATRRRWSRWCWTARHWGCQTTSGAASCWMTGRWLVGARGAGGDPARDAVRRNEAAGGGRASHPRGNRPGAGGRPAARRAPLRRGVSLA